MIKSAWLSSAFLCGWFSCFAPTLGQGGPEEDAARLLAYRAFSLLDKNNFY